MFGSLVFTALRRLGLVFKRFTEKLAVLPLIAERSSVHERSWGRLSPFALVLGCILAGATTPLNAAVFQFPGQTVVGVTSASQTVSVLVSTGGQLNAVKVLTSGVSNLDFGISGVGTCSTGTSYFSGQICSFP